MELLHGYNTNTFIIDDICFMLKMLQCIGEASRVEVCAV